MTPKEIKSELLHACTQVVEKRFARVKQVIADIEESLLEEDKSSAGDKHETGRAMLQIDRENAGKQLQEIEKLKQLLAKVDVAATSDYARLGSLVYASQATYFVSISIGDIEVNTAHYLCVALNSPIGMLLNGKRKGETFTFNGTEHTVNKIV